MKVFIPVLKNNTRLKIDHNKDILKLREKLEEETIELKNAIDDFTSCEEAETAENVVEESLDVIQVAVGIINIISEKYPRESRKKFKEHLPKLHNRGWRFEKILSVEEE